MSSCTGRAVGWCLASCLGVSVCASEVAAQSSSQGRTPVPLAVVAGVNLASLSLPLELFDFEGAAISNDRRSGFVGGVLARVQAVTRVVFETGALVSAKGTRMKISVPGIGSVSAEIRMLYLDVPALASVQVAGSGDRRLNLLAGPTVSVKLHARGRSTFLGEEIEETFTSDLPLLDFGLTVGGRADVGRVLVDVRYTHGLRDTASGVEASGVQLKHRVFSIMAGWRF